MTIEPKSFRNQLYDLLMSSNGERLKVLDEVVALMVRCEKEEEASRKNGLKKKGKKK